MHLTDAFNEVFRYLNEGHTDFLDRIHSNTEEDTPHLAYADWLEESGLPKHAEFIRNVISGRQRRRDNWNDNFNGVRITAAERHAPTDFATHGFHSSLDNKSFLDLSSQHPNAEGNRIFWTMGPLEPEKARQLRDELAEEGASKGSISNDDDDHLYRPTELKEGPDEVSEHLSRSERPMRYAAVPEKDIADDFKPEGVAPRVGIVLNQLASEPTDTGLIAEGVLRTGDTSVLKYLADKLDETDHPHKDTFDWRHIERGMNVDKALSNVFTGRLSSGSLQHRARASASHVVDSLRHRQRHPISRKTLLNAAQKSVPDATNADVLHSLLRLDRHSYVRGYHNVLNGGELTPEAFASADAPHLNGVWEVRNKALGVTDDPHRYADTRPANKRLYQLKERLLKYSGWKAPAGGMVTKESNLAVVGQFNTGGQFVRNLEQLNTAPTPTPTSTPTPKLTLEELKRRMLAHRQAF